MDGSSGRTGGHCPICGRATEQRWRPFCSRRCADIDLGRWLGGDYAVPAVETDEDDEAALEDATRRDSAEGDGQD
jgi:endogenous inhibitor of DNA gyrase (YacG/DUF329 family)